MEKSRTGWNPLNVYPPWYIRFYFIRVGTFPDLYGGGLESRARSCRSLASRERSSRVWRTLKNGGSLCISDGVNPLSHRFHGVLCSLSLPLLPPPFKLSGKLLVTKWKRGRKERTGQAPLLRPVVHFSIKTSCLFPRAFDSAPFTALVSIRSWTTLDAQLINRIISRGRWCNWSGSGCNQRERDLSKFFTFGSRWRETLERWNYYETLTVWWEKTKYGVWFGEYIIAGGNYAAHRP